jgi:hypothetical protein
MGPRPVYGHPQTCRPWFETEVPNATVRWQLDLMIAVQWKSRAVQLKLEKPLAVAISTIAHTAGNSGKFVVEPLGKLASRS